MLPPLLGQQMPETKRKAFALLLESLLALRRENKEVLWSSMIKDTMKRKKPSFNEAYHGYRTFSELLEDAQQGRAAGTGNAQDQRHLCGDAVRAEECATAVLRLRNPHCRPRTTQRPAQANPGSRPRAARSC